MIQITLKQMAYFEALAETLHFGRADSLVNVTQPALSTQVAEMEERLGCRLFERSGRRVRLSPDGEALRPKIERILAETRELALMARQGRGLLEGGFRLGIIPTVAPYLLPTLLDLLGRKYPGLRLAIREAVTADLVEATVTGSLDAMLAAEPIDHPAIESASLFNDRFLLAVSIRDPEFDSPPVSPDNPQLERLMLLNEGHCMREQALAVCREVEPVTMASYGATSLGTLLQMVAFGMGVTLVPEMALAAERSRPGLKFVPFADPQPARRICLAWRRSSSRADECRALAQLLTDRG